MDHRQWTRDELVQVLALYCQIPFGKMHARNSMVVEFASAIGRTPSAVAFKLVNFASLDPELRARGIRGMGNVSQADREIWDEFYQRWDSLADASVLSADGLEGSPALAHASSVAQTEDVREIHVRKGQAFFRAAVMAAHDWKCCVTGIRSPELLRASHIIPWSHSPELRLNPHNGLCLNALHDAAFDRGLITFSSGLELCVSARLCDEIPPPIYEEMFERWSGRVIQSPERFVPAAEMLEYHRSRVFCG